jgi:hypothetical protein
MGQNITDVRWSCSAQIDLLGFSNHLMTTNWDIRTPVGTQAIERLTILEDAIRIFDQERINHPDLYPKELHYFRFNDALFIGLDVKNLLPPTGRTTLMGGYNIEQLRKLTLENGTLNIEETIWESGSEVAKLLGLVARIHNYINEEEAKKSFPGCRTIVASGLRKCFINNEGKDDFFSANFSISMAFEAGKCGSSVGMKDNNLYVEDDVATAISYCGPCNAILGFSQFINRDSLFEPYQYKPKNISVLSKNMWIIPEPINIEIMKKRLVLGFLTPVSSRIFKYMRNTRELLKSRMIELINKLGFLYPLVHQHSITLTKKIF